MRKMIPILILAIAFLLNFTASPVAEILNPLKAGVPNTVTLADGNVVYDLNGEWDAVIDNKQY